VLCGDRADVLNRKLMYALLELQLLWRVTEFHFLLLSGNWEEDGAAAFSDGYAASRAKL
jgi:hypothetical protein